MIFFSLWPVDYRLGDKSGFILEVYPLENSKLDFFESPKGESCIITGLKAKYWIYPRRITPTAQRVSNKLDYFRQRNSGTKDVPVQFFLSLWLRRKEKIITANQLC